jgi:hypothetical protein
MGLGVMNVDHIKTYMNETVSTNSSTTINVNLLCSSLQRLLSIFRVKMFTQFRSRYYSCAS